MAKHLTKKDFIEATKDLPDDAKIGVVLGDYDQDVNVVDICTTGATGTPIVLIPIGVKF